MQDTPHLLEAQVRSYREFLQEDVPPSRRKAQGLQLAFEKVFPIMSVNGRVEMRFKGYRLCPPEFNVHECKERGLTYHRQVCAKLQLVILSEGKPVRDTGRVIKARKAEDVHLGEIPMMTETGSFIIDGTERMVMSQLRRPPDEHLDEGPLTQEQRSASRGRKNNEGTCNLGNIRVHSVGELVQIQYIADLRRIEKAIKDRLGRAATENLKPTDLINWRAATIAVRNFFRSSQLSQLMDQSNPLAEITHKRRVSALGPDGLMWKRADREVRSVYPTHYGRLCPIETPEDTNIGLISSMAMHARTNDCGFLEAPYRRVKNGKVTDKIDFLSAITESVHAIAHAGTPLDDDGRIIDELVSCRQHNEFGLLPRNEVTHMDVSPSQIASVSAALIPFLEHDDANRALMGSNMQRQAVSCIRPEKPLIGTGIETKVAVDSSAVVVAKRSGIIDFVDNARIVVRVDDNEYSGNDFGVDIYRLTRHERSNQNTSISQRPIVKVNERVHKGDIIADGSSTDLGELSLGKNLLAAFLPWDGYNFGDSILLSERVVEDDRFTSIHIKEFVVHAHEATQFGPEKITREIPRKSATELANLDNSGIITVGTPVQPGDILVGKVTPKRQPPPSSNEKLLRALFGERVTSVEDTSLRLPRGSSGVVIDVKVFTAEDVERDKRAKAIAAQDLQDYRKDLDDILRIIEENAKARLRQILSGTMVATAPKTLGLSKGARITVKAFEEGELDDWLRVSTTDVGINDIIADIHRHLDAKRKELESLYKNRKHKQARGYALPSNVIKTVKVYVAIKHNIQPGDMLAGRHGNIGVVSRIVPVEDMPYLEDGTPVDIVLNPLGVPSRMNIGQVLEMHLGLAAKSLGSKFGKMLHSVRAKQVKEIRSVLDKIYNRDQYTATRIDLSSRNDDEVVEIAAALKNGVPFATPIFDGATESDIREMLRLADAPESGQVILRDGRTGEPFKRPVTVGYLYMLKLHHLVDEKMRAHSTARSMGTQQPLHGKVQHEGQHLGETEMWTLAEYGAAHTLREMLTLKSDNIHGRDRTYGCIVKTGTHNVAPETPESFAVLTQEIRALALNLVYHRSNQAWSLFGFGNVGEECDEQPGDEEKVSIGIASPEVVRSWSHGAVRNTGTINYRSSKPERDGLFCAKIFGPMNDYECLCGKYKGIKHRGVICTKCGVEVTSARVRCERMGHIELACPVVHVLLKEKIGLALGLSEREVNRVLRYEQHIVTDPGATPLQRNQLLNPDDYRRCRLLYGNDFRAGIGADGLRELLKGLDLEFEAENLRGAANRTCSKVKQKKLRQRLKLIKGFIHSGQRPEWMILEALPVLPADLRPLDSIPGNGHHTASDLNKLYQLVIYRNNRLQRLIQLAAPVHFIETDRRLLQEAVNSLLKNGRNLEASAGARKRQLKSLSDIVKDDFQQNWLCKRIDYSGCSVISAEPNLKPHQCGLPKKMALELFKPFVCHRLIVQKIASNQLRAETLVDSEDPRVWNALDEVVRQHPVLLSNAPLPNRLGIQAFDPILIEGKAIQLHPLDCVAFKADFEGDQVSVHVPLSVDAQNEAFALMLSRTNVLSSVSGEPIIVPTQDIVLGLYYMTCKSASAAGSGRCFEGPDEVERAVVAGAVDLHASVRVRITESYRNHKGEIVSRQRRKKTTVGRALLSKLLPVGLPFKLLNRTLKKRDITRLVDVCFRRCGLRETVIFIDRLTKAGFTHATAAGISICLDDMVIPEEKASIIAKAEAQAKHIQREYDSGILSDDERHHKVIDLWDRADKRVTAHVMAKLSTETVTGHDGKQIDQPSFNSIFMMSDSGARGSATHVRHIVGMRGLVAKPSGQVSEIPVTSNFREGLNSHQYFISAYGGRKGLVDTRLKTSEADCLARRLVAAANDLIVTEEDCGTTDGLTLRPVIKDGKIVVPLHDRVLGRLSTGNIVHPQTGRTVKSGNAYIDEDLAGEINNMGINELKVRSPVTCKTSHGLCACCYGRDLGCGNIVNLGEAVGVIAAQSISESSSQLPMQTFYVGGLPRVSELFDASPPKVPGILARYSGLIRFEGYIRGEERISIIDEKGHAHEQWIPRGRRCKVQNGQTVSRGDQLTDGEPSSQDILDLLGIEELTHHIIDNVQNVYRHQGVTINDKHIEVIVHQMLRTTVNNLPEDAEDGQSGCKRAVLGISKAELSTDSFISAASLQETTRVLTEASVAGRVDTLRGLKENVIIGRLIPAGTGFRRDASMEDDEDPPEESASDAQESDSDTFDNIFGRNIFEGGGRARHPAKGRDRELLLDLTLVVNFIL